MRFALFLILIWFHADVLWAQSSDQRGDSRQRGGGSTNRSSSDGGRSERYERSGRGDRGDRGDRGGSDENTDRSRGSRFGGGGFGGGPGGFGGGFGGTVGGGSPFGGGLGDMIRRFDRNANNMIDPDEVVGPAGFFLQRMAQNNPKIDPTRPIPIDLILGEVERFRGGMMGGMGSGGGEEEALSSASSEPELLVPDFSLDFSPEPIQGFGVAAAARTTPVNDRDRAEAEERLRRYDQNRDGFLTPDEMAQGRWSGDPMQYDRNRDGKLSIEELATRQAERRSQEASGSQAGGNSASPRPGDWGSGMSGGWSRGTNPTAQGGNLSGSGGEPDNGSPRKTPEERFGDARSYRIASAASAAESLPAFFLSSDSNGDGQVTLKEYAAILSEQTLSDFNKWDLNGDGLITRREAIAANAFNGAANAASNGAANQTSITTPTPESTGNVITSPPTRSASPPAGEPPVAAPSSGPANASVGKFSEAEFVWAKRQIAKYDTDGDGALSRSEWDKMVIKPHSADTNRDGKITAEEYATFRAIKK